MNTSSWNDRRNEAISSYLERGLVVTEPNTVWGTGAISAPAVRGIAKCYGLGWMRANGELIPYTPESAVPYSRNYFATKYPDELTERIFDSTMGGGYNEDIGSVDELGWFARVEFGVDDLMELGIIYIAEWIVAQNRGLPIGAILYNDDQGFCSADLFWDREEDSMKLHWKEIEEMYEKYWEAEDGEYE